MIGQDLQKAAQLLRSGEVVAIPTETVYGLAANALDPIAVSKIFEAKNRPSFDPLIVHVSSIDAVRKLVDSFPPKAQLLAEAFWPGPLTMILPKSNLIPPLVTSGLPFVGIRMPNHPLLQSLFELIDFPLAAPSANPFSYVSPTNAQHVEDQLGKKIPYVLDGGPSSVGVESTIISFQNPNQPILLRYGGIAIEQIEEQIGPLAISISNNSNPSAPGQLDKHYATGKPLILIQNPSEMSGDTFNIGFGKEVGIKYDINLSAQSDLKEAARNIFAALRIADQSSKPTIKALLLPEEGLGLAINDRLRRAAK